MLLAVLGCLIAISQSSMMAADEIIPTALAIDLLISFPVVYFLMFRKTAVPRITVVPVFFLCFFIASSVLPDGVPFLGYAAIILIPAVELVGLTYLGFRIYRSRKVYLYEKSIGSDLMEALRLAFERELKPAALARAAAFEVGVIAFLLFIWRRPTGESFAYNRDSGAQVLLSVLLFLLVAETIAVHFLLAMWSDTLAWVVTALSIYLTMQIVAHLKALILRPTVITENDLYLRCGILGDAVVPRDIINSAEAITVVEEPAIGLDLLPMGAMSQPNVQLTLVEPVTVYGVYGLKKTANVIRLWTDDPDLFIEAIRR